MSTSDALLKTCGDSRIPLKGLAKLFTTTFGLVTLVLGVTAALSVAAPAWRAARIDPSVALRNP